MLEEEMEEGEAALEVDLHLEVEDIKVVEDIHLLTLIIRYMWPDLAKEQLSRI